MTRAGPSQSPYLDGAPISPRVTLPRRKYMTQVPGSKLTFFLANRVLGATNGIFRLFLQISVFIADIRKVSISEGHRRRENRAPSLSAPNAH